MVRRAIFVDRRAGGGPPPQGDPRRAHLRVRRRPRERRRRTRLMAGAERRPSSSARSRRSAAKRRRGAADRPLPRDHRDPALRRPRLAGAGARRPPGRHLRRPRPRRVRSGPGRGRVMDTRSWSATSSGSSASGWGRARSCWPATRWAPTPPSPTRCAIPTGWPAWS